MGAWIDFTSHITIGNKTFTNGAISEIAFSDINNDFIETFRTNKKIHTIQINQCLPLSAFKIIDELIAQRGDVTFRIYGLSDVHYFDFDVLTTMENLTSLTIDAHLVNNHKLFDMDKLCNLKHLKKLNLFIFDLQDYSFIQHLNKNIESITILADTMIGTPAFDCKWLLDFPNLHTLGLGKKSKKNIKCIADLSNLRSLTIRGIKIDDYSFLQKTTIESLSILWCGVGNIDSLSTLKTIKNLELWRIPKLTDLSVIRKLENLEMLSLQDLSHINELPNLSSLNKLKCITIINTPIDESVIPDGITIKHW